MSATFLLVLVEESANSVGFYDSVTGQPSGRVALGLWPHEVEVSRDGRTAYVTNFGLRDYDLTIGFAGNSISVIDVPTRCERHRLYTSDSEFRYWAPHGVKLNHDETELYVNVERVIGLRSNDPASPPGMEQTRMLVFDLQSRKIARTFSVTLPVGAAERSEDPTYQYGVPRGTHNFYFSPSGKQLWLFSGLGGVTCVDPLNGSVIAHFSEFTGAVRGLSFNRDGSLLVSATDEIGIIDPDALRVVNKFGNLGVGQILYSLATPDVQFALAPAVWQGQVLIIDLASGKVKKAVPTGIDPVHIVMGPDEQSAFVTHGRSNWAAEVAFGNFSVIRTIATLGGPNGAAIAGYFPNVSQRPTLQLGAVLPFTGEYSVEGRELRLGYEFWQDTVNAAGGILIGEQPYQVELLFRDSTSTTDPALLRSLAAELINSGVCVLLGTYPSPANVPVATVAAEQNVAFVTATATGPSVRGISLGEAYVNVATPVDVPLAACLDALWQAVTPKPQSAAILVCDEDEALEGARHLACYCVKQRLMPMTVGNSDLPFIPYPHGSTDFSQTLSELQQSAPDLLLHIGHRSEAAAIIAGAQALGFVPGAIMSDCGVTVAPFRSALGFAAQALWGIVQWSSELSNSSQDRFTCAQDFARNYYQRYSEQPSSLAAGAAACGVICEKGFTGSASLDMAKFAKTVRALEFTSVFGDIRFDADGNNSGKDVLVVQLIQTPTAIGEHILWPRGLANTRLPLWPAPIQS